MSNVIERAVVQLDADPRGLERGVRSAQQTLGGLTDVVRNNWWGLRNVGIALTGVGAAAAAGIGVAVKHFADWESGMTAVARTTNASGKELDALEQKLKNIAKTSPIAPTDVLQTAQAAGAFGIPTEEVADFTKTVSMVAATTDASVGEIAEAFARLRQQLGLPTEDMDAFGSLVLELGRSAVASEKDILAYTQALAGFGAAFGVPVEKLAALATTMASVGVPMQTASRNVQMTVTDMTEAFNEMGPRAEEFAKTAGIPVQEFATLLREDAVGALAALSKGLSQLSPGELIDRLDQMGISAERQRATILALAAAEENASGGAASLSNGLQMVREGLGDGKELQDRYKDSVDDLASKFVIFKNNVVLAFQAFGATVAPVVGPAIDLFAKLAAMFGHIPGPLRLVIVGAVALTGFLTLLAAAAFLVVPKILLAAESLGRARIAMAATGTQGYGLIAMLKALAAQATMTGTAVSGAMGKGVKAPVITQSVTSKGQTVFKDESGKFVSAANGANALAAGQLKVADTATKVATNTAKASFSMRAMAGATRLAGSAMAFLAGPWGMALQFALLFGPALFDAATGANRAADAARKLGAANEELKEIIRGAAGGNKDLLRDWAEQALQAQGLAEKLNKLGLEYRELADVIAGTADKGTKEKVGKKLDNDPGWRKWLPRGGDAEAFSEEGRAQRDVSKAFNEVKNQARGAAAEVDKESDSAKKNADAARKQKEEQIEVAQALSDKNAAIAGARAESLIEVPSAQLGFIKAQQNLNQAKRAGAQHALDLRSANLSVAQSYLSYEGAVRRVQDAQRTLSTARAEQLRELQAAEQGLADARASYEDSIYRIAEAEKKLAELRSVDINELIERAELKTAQARLAHEEAIARITDAERKLWMLRQETIQGRIEEAENKLAVARANAEENTRNIIELEQKLAEARSVPFADLLAEAEDKLADARDSYADSIDAIADAEDKLAKLRKYDKTREMADATNDLVQAQMRLRGAHQAVRDAEWQLRYLREEGAGARDLEEAEQDLADAHAGVSDAAEGVRDAEDEVNEVRNYDHARALASAERDVAEAYRQSREAAREIQAAERELNSLRALGVNPEVARLEREIASARLQTFSNTQAIRAAEQELALQRSGMLYEEIRAAERDLQGAILGTQAATYAVRDAERELAAERAGRHFDEIMAAERELQGAVRASEAAARQVQAAEQELAQARIDFASDRKYRDAELELREAQMGVAQAALAIKQAEEERRRVQSVNPLLELRDAELQLMEAAKRVAEALARQQAAEEGLKWEDLSLEQQQKRTADQIDILARTMDGPMRTALQNYANELRGRTNPESSTAKDHFDRMDEAAKRMAQNMGIHMPEASGQIAGLSGSIGTVREHWTGLYGQIAGGLPRLDGYNIFSDIANAASLIPGPVGLAISMMAELKRKAEEAAWAAAGVPGGPNSFGFGFGMFGATGGIFNRPTPMIIGEAGKEVLLPLTDPKRTMELAHKSGLLDLLATQIGASEGAAAFTGGFVPKGGGIVQRVVNNTQQGDTIQIATVIQDAQEIAQEIAWRKRIRSYG